MMKNKIYSRISMLLFLCFTFFVNAQRSIEEVPEPPMVPTSADAGAPIASPIDNYIVFLLLAVIGLTVYFIKHRKVNTISK